MTAASPSISKEKVYFSCFFSSLNLIAFSISFSKTNCFAKIFTACLIAFLNNGSDKFLTILPRIFLFSFSFSSTIFPVNKNAIDEILTNKSLSFLIYFFQSPIGILSSIKSFIVLASGIRNKASAKHIKTIPSLLDNENSCINFPN